MQRTIIAGVEPGHGDEGGDALVLAALLAKPEEAEVVAVTGYDPDPLGWPVGADEHVDALQRLVADRRPALGDTPVRTCAAPTSSPSRLLYELAGELGPRAIVLGSSHRARGGRVLPGRIGERLLHGAPCPVAVAPRDFAKRHPHGASLRTIGVGFADTPEAVAALRYAAALAARTGARLDVIEVVEPSAYTGAIEIYEATGHDPFLDLRRRHLDVLERTVAGLGHDVVAECRVVEGHAVEELTTASQDLDALVVGSRRYGPLRGVLLGGVSARLIREAWCPVIVLPRGASAQLDAAPARRQQVAG